MSDLRKLSKYLALIKDEKEIQDLFKMLLTENERKIVLTRVKILQMLDKKISQEKIAKKLKVGVATVTRGAREYNKNKNKVWWRDFMSWWN